ncbi:acetolactate synthase OS=Tsukamurella paurometabola (strain ATCC 8368 / DSM / CCUG 35730 / CIP 100753 / JCM 10117 / KCTC 9821 / NBRC 16120 / NCIMB 702349/ NCTC 13040) OX=521096 GN=Tpau_4034 PE=3 SV=1 [Tsukamurella paurometabola]|uniref:acetolactate synthase n=1 Tax=Tsukamurella paurometabola (strain ATCC 8368 / DSM 20162 / CCUG 35730 / CIP 100753 / JCM 10117 / KCTC 9821 / NBRC 16120 / NCIMB 702349 / NCTC 13040) TaxID=521096 RepID=D5UNB0_TSUPD|nr:thiamine pyrophosphate-dependent enzyme [Tsukamurella paurometabola]ADG80605.1 thiamine pyrophosphate protein central region [Tsukamurella paurometabola DSM 20162]SUP40257.1 Acetolactate synthase large subunit IlvB1 [Tsukamurella paurometabola]
MSTMDNQPNTADPAHRYADTTGRAVMECLASYGITTVFGIPGTHNLELYRPLADLGIRAVTNRHEQGSGYGADGWSQRTGLPGVVITTSGPGLQNALSAIGTAFCESRPLLVISPGTPRGAEFADVGTLHETKNASAMVDAVAQWSRRVLTAEAAVEAVHDAFALFTSGRPRPVHIEIPLDLLEEPAGVDPVLRCARPAAAPAEPDPGDVERAAQLLSGAERPVIIAGGGATRAAARVAELAERLCAPVLTTTNGKAVLDERHALSLGANLRLPAAREYAEDADVLLVVGSKLGEAELWWPSVAARGSVIRVDIAADQLQKNLAADVGLLGDSAAALDALLHRLRPADRPRPDLDPVRRAIAAEMSAVDADTVALAEDIATAIPAGAIVAGDSSQVVYLGLSNVLTQSAPHGFLYMPTYATLGYGLPAAIGARIADPDVPVVAVLGDGALMFSVNELATAVEQRIDLTIVCVDNGGYAEIRQNEVERGIAPIGVELHQPDWAALAEAFGARGRRVERTGLTAAVAESVAAGGVHLLHLRTA